MADNSILGMSQLLLSQPFLRLDIHIGRMSGEGREGMRLWKRKEKDGIEEGCEWTIGDIYFFLVAVLSRTTTTLTAVLHLDGQH